MLEQVKRNPLTLNGKPMKNAQDYLYLGSVVSEKGVSNSADMSVKKKIGKVKYLIYEIKAVI